MEEEEDQDEANEVVAIIAEDAVVDARAETATPAAEWLNTKVCVQPLASMSLTTEAKVQQTKCVTHGRKSLTMWVRFTVTT